MAKQEFQINATGAAFDTLSKKLYSNPILAVIRELSTNANDAHIMAGNEEPFSLHIPTREEPYFKIRDYGTGLSEDLINNVYTTFFCSTKSEDESQTGYFGLGSKSPYALVDEFMVTSWFGGKKIEYKMGKTDGIPNVEKVSEEVSNEHSGLQIEFPYSCDYYEFENEAKNFFVGTKFMPEINLDLPMEEYCVDREFYTNNSILFEGQQRQFYTHRYETVYLNVAGVSFPVSIDKLGAASGEIRDLIRGIELECMNICCGKNDVTITPSREELHYDQKTVDFLVSAIKKAVADKFASFDLDTCSVLDLCYIIRQTYDINLQAKAKTIIDSYAKPQVIRMTFNHRGNASAYQCSIYDSLTYRSYRCTNIKRVVLDVSNLPTIKAKLINNFLTGVTVEDNKITSKALIEQLKMTRKAEDCIFFYFSDNIDFTNKKLETEIVKFGDLVTKAKAAPKKRGFLTKYSIIVNGANLQYNYNGRTDPNDDEIPLIIRDNEQDSVNKYKKIINHFNSGCKLAIRPCIDSVFDKYHKDTKTLKEYVSEIINQNKASLQADADKYAKMDNLETIFSSYFNDEGAKKVYDVINLPKYAAVCSKVPALAYAKANLTPTILNEYRDSLTMNMINIADIKPTFTDHYDNTWKSKYPMMKYVNISDDNIEDCLDYISLVEGC